MICEPTLGARKLCGWLMVATLWFTPSGVAQAGLLYSYEGTEDDLIEADDFVYGDEYQGTFEVDEEYEFTIDYTDGDFNFDIQNRSIGALLFSDTRSAFINGSRVFRSPNLRFNGTIDGQNVSLKLEITSYLDNFGLGDSADRPIEVGDEAFEFDFDADELTVRRRSGYTDSHAEFWRDRLVAELQGFGGYNNLTQEGLDQLDDYLRAEFAANNDPTGYDNFFIGVSPTLADLRDASLEAALGISDPFDSNPLLEGFADWLLYGILDANLANNPPFRPRSDLQELFNQVNLTAYGAFRVRIDPNELVNLDLTDFVPKAQPFEFFVSDRSLENQIASDVGAAPFATNDLGFIRFRSQRNNLDPPPGGVVPEPASYLIWCLSVGSLIGIRFRQRHRGASADRENAGRANDHVTM